MAACCWGPVLFLQRQYWSGVPYVLCCCCSWSLGSNSSSLAEPTCFYTWPNWCSAQAVCLIFHIFVLCYFASSTHSSMRLKAMQNRLHFVAPQDDYK